MNMKTPARFATYALTLAFGVLLGMEIPQIKWQVREWRYNERHEKEVRENPRDSMAWFALGCSKAKAHDYAGATLCFQTATQLNPNDCASLDHLAMCSLRLGKFEDAKRYADQALNIVKDTSPGSVDQAQAKHDAIVAICDTPVPLRAQAMKGLPY